MIELGKVQTLKVIRIKEFGVYLSEGEEGTDSVLLPKKQVPEGAKSGDEVSVFIYKDSEDRMIATTAAPKLQAGQCALLQVKDVGKIGAFLDMGLEKDLFLPFKEQTHPVQAGETVFVALYIDKSSRLAATMRVYGFMSDESPYRQDDEVTGLIYEINPRLGAFVAVDNRYYGLIPQKEIFASYREGDSVVCRVTKVREDGKLDLSPRQKAYLQMDTDKEIVLNALAQHDGILPFSDKAEPEIIKKELKMSKNAFKRAVGRLLKEGKVKITEKTIERI